IALPKPNLTAIPPEEPFSTSRSFRLRFSFSPLTMNRCISSSCCSPFIRWGAGIGGWQECLTRWIGLVLAVTFVCEFLRQKPPELRQQWSEKQVQPLLRLGASFAAVVAVPLALGIYAYGLKIIMGDPLAFSHAQAQWRTGLNFPWVAPLRALKFLLQHSIFSFTAAHIMIDLSALGLFLVLMVLCFFGPVRLER